MNLSSGNLSGDAEMLTMPKSVFPITLVRISTLFILGTIPILFASVQPWVCAFYSFCMIVGFIIFLWQDRMDSITITLPIWVKLAVGSFLTVSFFLILPLPPTVLSYLSPMRYKIISTAWSLTNSVPTWETISYSSRNAFNWWLFIISLGFFFVVLRHLCIDRKTLKTVVFVIISIGLFEAIYGLAQALVPSMGVLWVDHFQEFRGYARGTYINRNHFAGFIEMIWPLALGFTMSLSGRGYTIKTALSSDRLNRQALMALGIVVLLLSLLFTRSRAGIAGGFIGLITFTIISRSNNKGMTHRSRWLLGSIVVLLGVYGITIGVGPIVERFLAIGNDNSRMDFWRDSIPIIIDHPFGIGLRNYETVFQIYNKSFISGKTVTFAHNDFLQLLVETGWIGFISLIGAYIFFICKSVGHIKGIDIRRDPLRYYLAVGAFSGLISMTFHSFFDFNLQIPANCAYFVSLMAILHSCAWSNNVSEIIEKSEKRIMRNIRL